MIETRRQCASCPFRAGNDEKFAAFLQRIDRGSDDTVADRVEFYRDYARECALAAPDNFTCHDTVYDRRSGKNRPRATHRLCKGAQKFRAVTVESKED